MGVFFPLEDPVNIQQKECSGSTRNYRLYVRISERNSITFIIKISRTENHNYSWEPMNHLPILININALLKHLILHWVALTEYFLGRFPNLCSQEPPLPAETPRDDVQLQAQFFSVGGFSLGCCFCKNSKSAKCSLCLHCCIICYWFHCHWKPAIFSSYTKLMYKTDCGSFPNIYYVETYLVNNSERRVVLEGNSILFQCSKISSSGHTIYCMYCNSPFLFWTYIIKAKENHLCICPSKLWITGYNKMELKN